MIFAVFDPSPLTVYINCSFFYIYNFYKSVNGILAKCKGRMNETVLLHLFNTYCKPLFIYACEYVLLLMSEGDRLFNAWNSIYWKLFGVEGYN